MSRRSRHKGSGHGVQKFQKSAIFKNVCGIHIEKLKGIWDDYNLYVIEYSC